MSVGGLSLLAGDGTRWEHLEISAVPVDELHQFAL
jgi:hypothetical protein